MKLIGRDTDLALVSQHVRTGRNLAIWGAEGIGKTELVSTAVERLPGVLYCADTSTLKTACESLLTQLGLSLRRADNIRRKRTILEATSGRQFCFVFDQVGHVTPKLLSLSEAVHDSHPMLLAARSLAWTDTGHLKMILWDFDRLGLTNLRETEARLLVESKSVRLDLHLPDLPQFARELWRLTRGNPRRIVELCEQAASGRYMFGRRMSTKPLELDCRIDKLGV